jgi:hypothetical protein
MLAAAATFGAVAISPVAPTANADATWAAIAVSPEADNSGAGWAYDAGSQAEAERVAIKSCIDEGNVQCQIAISRSTGCLALADSPDAWSPGTGATVEEAEADALATNDGGTILVSGCTGA